MAIKLSADARDALLDALGAFIGTAFLVRIYDGVRPADVATAITGQTLLAELTGDAVTPWLAAAAGVLEASPIADGTGLATSTATWFRLFQSDGTTAVIDGDVGAAGADINLANVNIVTSAAVPLAALAIYAHNE